MKNRRDFIHELKNLGLIGTASVILPGLNAVAFAFEGEADQTPAIDEEGFVTLYDTYMMATYMDGGLGPKTGICKVDYILADEEVTLDFWHGHGGKIHQFTLTKEHFRDLKLKKKVWVTTTTVDRHTHKLFIDPVNPKWRVPGAQPIAVPIDDETPPPTEFELRSENEEY